MDKKNPALLEFGDFQTPPELARAVVRIVADRGLRPASIVEPTCGLGNLLVAALDAFPDTAQALGVEINPRYLAKAGARLAGYRPSRNVDLRSADFFDFGWLRTLSSLPEPVLIIGNPPWVTASALGALQSGNLPTKSNFQNRRGFDAISGKSNFDIAEWMLIHLLEGVAGRRALVAILVKTTVARKVLQHVWRTGLSLSDAAMYLIDSRRYFGVDVDACLLVCVLGGGQPMHECKVVALDRPSAEDHTIAWRDGTILADLRAYEQYRYLCSVPGADPIYRWRSGIKHDCSNVMELQVTDNGLVNGLGERIDLEPDCLFPMLKGSAVATGGPPKEDRYMVVPQRETGESTQIIKHRAPLTWAYLCKHADRLDGRRSSIYRNRPRFAIFGVGPYTFTPWKVAICALYKRLTFTVVGPRYGKPVVFDDTVYHLSCESEREAQLLAEMLSSPLAKAFLGAFIFWDAKRPITVELLHRLDVLALAEGLGRANEVRQLRSIAVSGGRQANLTERLLFS